MANKEPRAKRFNPPKKAEPPLAPPWKGGDAKEHPPLRDVFKEFF
jgi:hypothetical protein